MGRKISATITDEELERIRQETQERDKTRPRAKAARFDERDKRLIVELRNGVILMIPVHLLQGLADAPASQVAQVGITASGNALHWEALDVQLGVEALASGVFGTRAWMEHLSERGQLAGEQLTTAEMGRKGGSATSPAKTAAARENGKKGGRPRKVA